jgi:tetratricopeptide (TPR) repeat protein
MRLLLFALLFCTISVNAQTYPKYSTQKKDTLIKPRNTEKSSLRMQMAPAAPQKASAIKKHEGDFQKLMEKALVQLQEKKYQKAVDFYTEALGVSTEENVWRALVSRATTYLMMNNFEKAIADYTTMINDNHLPDQKKLAYTYMSRARAAFEMKNMELACNDLKKAKELGLPEILATGVDCK